MSGAIAGSVREVELTDDGTALVTLSLNEGTEPPRSDAAASIRQQDVTGDSYVSLSTGEDARASSATRRSRPSAPWSRRASTTC